jgi:hypothetical protein
MTWLPRSVAASATDLHKDGHSGPVQSLVPAGDGSSAFDGIAPNPTNELANSLDREGFVVHPNTGNHYVADEYGPSLLECNRSGQLWRRLAVLDSLTTTAGSAVNDIATSAPGSLTSGREPNCGFEGLVISPDCRYLDAMLPKAFANDGSVVSGSFQRSMYRQIFSFEAITGNMLGQTAYRVDSRGTSPTQGRGISAVVALDDNGFMVIERNKHGLGPTSNHRSPDKRSTSWTSPSPLMAPARALTAPCRLQFRQQKAAAMRSGPHQQLCHDRLQGRPRHQRRFAVQRFCLTPGCVAGLKGLGSRPGRLQAVAGGARSAAVAGSGGRLGLDVAPTGSAIVADMRWDTLIAS